MASLRTETFTENCLRIPAAVRSRIVSKLVDVSSRHTLDDETLHLAVYYLDRVCATERIPSPENLMMCGATAFWTASKYEEPQLYGEDALEVSCQILIDDGYSADLPLRMKATERRMLIESLEWQLSTATAINFVRTWEKEAEAVFADTRIAQLAALLLELSLYSWTFTLLQPSVVAAASVALARAELGHDEPWPHALAQTSRISRIPNNVVNQLLELQRTAKAALSGAGSSKAILQRSEHQGTKTLEKFDALRHRSCRSTSKS